MRDVFESKAIASSSIGGLSPDATILARNQWVLQLEADKKTKGKFGQNPRSRMARRQKGEKEISRAMENERDSESERWRDRETN